MKIKTGLVIPMMAAMSARVDQADRVAEQNVPVYVVNNLGVLFPKAVSTPTAVMFAGAGVK
jgi:hypothetical protein